MKKFLLINGLLMIVFLAANYAILLYVNQSLEKEFVGEFEIFEFESDTYDYVNVGTSHGSVSFDWKTLELNGLNLAKSGQPLIEDNFLLNQHADYISDETVIIIPISFHTLCMDQELSAKTQSIYIDSFKLLGMVRSDRTLEFLFDRKDGDYPPDAFNYDRFTPNSLKPSECTHDELEESIDALDDILNSFPNSILVTTPYYLESLDSVDEFNIFYSTVEEISQIYDVPYYDYSRDERFNDPQYFYNNTHLNTLGREKFTQYFYDEVLTQLNTDNSN